MVMGFNRGAKLGNIFCASQITNNLDFNITRNLDS